MDGNKEYFMDKMDSYHQLSRIVESLDSFLLSPVLTEDVMDKCGPFLRQLVLTAEEERVRKLLDSIFARLHELFAPLFSHVGGCDIVDNLRPLTAEIASKASILVITEVLEPCGLATSSVFSQSSSISGRFHAAWCSIGRFVMRLVRESTSTTKAVSSDKCNTSLQRTASLLLLQRIRWRCNNNEISNQPTPSDDGGCGIPQFPMVSFFTVVWDCILTFLSLLCDSLGLADTLDDTHVEGAVSVAKAVQHPLLHIITDCIGLMIARNHFLLQEAQNSKSFGVASETLCLAVNNFAWLQQYCKKLVMTNNVEIEELFLQCSAAVLQDIVTGCVAEMQNILLPFFEPCNGDGRQRAATHRVLVTRLSAIRGLCNGLACSLFRGVVLWLVLERSLQPVVMKLLDEKGRNENVLNNNAKNSAGRFHGSFLLAGLPLEKFYDGGNDANKGGCCNEGEATVLQRLSEILALLETEDAFGVLCCQQSSAFCSLRHLLSRITQ